MLHRVNLAKDAKRKIVKKEFSFIWYSTKQNPHNINSKTRTFLRGQQQKSQEENSLFFAWSSLCPLILHQNAATVVSIKLLYVRPRFCVSRCLSSYVTKYYILCRYIFLTNFVLMDISVSFL